MEKKNHIGLGLGPHTYSSRKLSAIGTLLIAIIAANQMLYKASNSPDSPMVRRRGRVGLNGRLTTEMTGGMLQAG